jgi:hypothetical protein
MLLCGLLVPPRVERRVAPVLRKVVLVLRKVVLALRKVVLVALAQPKVELRVAEAVPLPSSPSSSAAMARTSI